VRRTGDVEAVDRSVATHVIALDQPDPAGQVREHAPDDVERVISALMTAARAGALSVPIGDPLPLGKIADAHDRVDAGARERGLLSLP